MPEKKEESGWNPRNYWDKDDDTQQTIQSIKESEQEIRELAKNVKDADVPESATPTAEKSVVPTPTPESTQIKANTSESAPAPVNATAPTPAPE